MKKYWSISKLKNWKDNPRGITKNGYERLKKQIKKFGQLVPLVICDGSKILPDGTVLSGNMRLRVHQELKTSDIWVESCAPKTKAEALEIALTCNDRAGYYEEDSLLELAYSLKTQIDFRNYSIDFGEPLSVDFALKRVEPNEKELDENLLTENKCPKCGYKW